MFLNWRKTALEKESGWLENREKRKEKTEKSLFAVAGKMAH
jgi:hypothetical protein